GNPVDVIDQSKPGRYTITYEVTDKDGNTTQVEVDYVLQDTVVNPPDPIVPTPDDPGPTDPTPGNPDDGNGSSGVVPTPPTVTVKPGDGGGSGSVLKPQPDDNAPNDGRQHVIVPDELTVPTRDMQMTPDDFAALFQERYSIASAQPDGKISAGEVRIYDAQGKRLEYIDRSVEGSYVIEQVFTDSAGNTTTVRLSYRVKAESAVGSLTGDGDGGWSSADGSLGRTWRTATSLPQTGPFSVLCPLHLLFLALAAIAALYGAVRLRMESAARRNLKARDAWVRDQLRAGDDAAGLRAAVRRGGPRTDDEQAAAATGTAAARRRFAVDGGVLGLVACMAVWLAWSPWCAYDGLLAACVAGLCALCMVMIHVSAWSTARCRRRCWIAPWAADRGLV
ncbi:immunoglobulin-like domain-containing protein, partial [Adlercreutzia sp. R21]|uniref:immunoglobulin-like domain-containing protein n=1 Tax=Adlercreutzia wanghongyangiae TaxID=3111451 RepID=UPI002DBCF234